MNLGAIKYGVDFVEATGGLLPGQTLTRDQLKWLYSNGEAFNPNLPGDHFFRDEGWWNFQFSDRDGLYGGPQGLIDYYTQRALRLTANISADKEYKAYIEARTQAAKEAQALMVFDERGFLTDASAAAANAYVDAKTADELAAVNAAEAQAIAVRNAVDQYIQTVLNTATQVPTYTDAEIVSIIRDELNNKGNTAGGTLSFLINSKGIDSARAKTLVEGEFAIYFADLQAQQLARETSAANAAAAQAAAQRAAEEAAAAAARVAAEAAAATAAANEARAKAALDAKYAFFDASVKNKSALEKAQYFNFLKSRGYSEEIIFEAIAYWIGPQSSSDIAELKRLSEQIIKEAQAAAIAQKAAEEAAQKAAEDAAAAAAKVAADAAAATAKANADKAKAELDLKYGFFDRTIVNKTAEQKAQYFNFLKSQGKSEAVIFEAIAYWLGPQPPEDIAALKTLADELAKPRPIIGKPIVDVIPFTPGPGATTTTQPTGGNTALLLAAGLAALTLLG